MEAINVPCWFNVFVPLLLKIRVDALIFDGDEDYQIFKIYFLKISDFYNDQRPFKTQRLL